MAIIISQLAEEAQSFENEQLEAFNAFVDCSKELKGSLKNVREQASKIQNGMTEKLDSLSDDITNSSVPIEVLSSNEAYTSALEACDILPEDLNCADVINQYMDNFLQKVDETMKDRVAQDE